MSSNAKIPAAKVTAGIAALIIAVALPGYLALGTATHFGHKREYPDPSNHGFSLPVPLVLCLMVLAIAGVFLIARRKAQFSKTVTTLVAAGLLIGLIPSFLMVLSIRAENIKQEEDLSRFVRDADADLVKAGYVKNADGTWRSVENTNAEAKSNQTGKFKTGR